jgi:hypothetical protein
MFRHLTVGHPDARFRHKLIEVPLHGPDGLNAVVNKEDLPAALQFA